MTDGWYGSETATFGDRLSAAREAQGLTIADLARKLGVRAETIGHWEADASAPRGNRVQMLSGLLGVSLGWLLTGEGTGPEGPDSAEAPAADQARQATALVGEMQQLRREALHLGARIGAAEKRLRLVLAGEA